MTKLFIFAGVMENLNLNQHQYQSQPQQAPVSVPEPIPQIQVDAIRQGYRLIDIPKRFEALTKVAETIKYRRQQQKGGGRGKSKNLSAASFIHSFYFNIKEKLPIYYSKDTLYKREMGKNIFIFNTVLDIFRFVGDYKTGKISVNDGSYFKVAKPTDMIFADNASFFLNTSAVDHYIPLDLKYRDTEVHYTDIKTNDSIYIKIYRISSSMSNILILYTSSGIWSLNPFSSMISGAVKFQYKYTILAGTVSDDLKEQRYEKRLKKILTAKRASIYDMRLFNNVFNPISPAYLDIDKAIRNVYGALVRPRDRKKIIEAERIKKLLVGELMKLMPDLAKGLRKYNSPDELGNYLKEMRESAIEKGTTNEQAQVFALILQAAYGDQIANPNQSMPLVMEEGSGFNNTIAPANDEYLKHDATKSATPVPTPPTPLSDNNNSNSNGSVSLNDILNMGKSEPVSVSQAEAQGEAVAEKEIIDRKSVV